MSFKHIVPVKPAAVKPAPVKPQPQPKPKAKKKIVRRRPIGG
jgi:hypothetical protein